MRQEVNKILKAFLVILMAFQFSADAQINNAIFDGSFGDGYQSFCFVQSATNMIFDGSSGDGYAALCFQQPSSNDIFFGSNGDGYDALCFEQPSTNLIFYGSIGDGYDAFCFEQPATNAIFGGSSGDGYVMYCFEQSSTNAIFGGSNGDGYDVACFEAQSSNPIFGGSLGDGYDVVCFEAQATNAIFGGSIGDGYDMNCAIVNPVQLPIELLVFDGVLDGENALLNWVVATEIDNAYFILERSLDGLEFEDIAIIASLGNTLNTREYLYTDFIKPLFGNPVVYYRLKQVDLDESYEYTHIIALPLPMESVDGEYLLYPNPAKETVFLRYTLSFSENIEIELFDNLGRKQGHYSTPSQSLLNGYRIPIGHLPSGTYHIRVIDGSIMNSRTFIKLSP